MQTIFPHNNVTAVLNQIASHKEHVKHVSIINPRLPRSNLMAEKDAEFKKWIITEMGKKNALGMLKSVRKARRSIDIPFMKSRSKSSLLLPDTISQPKDASIMLPTKEKVEYNLATEDGEFGPEVELKSKLDAYETKNILVSQKKRFQKKSILKIPHFSERLLLNTSEVTFEETGSRDEFPATEERKNTDLLDLGVHTPKIIDPKKKKSSTKKHVRFRPSRESDSTDHRTSKDDVNKKTYEKCLQQLIKKCGVDVVKTALSQYQ